MTSVDSYDHVPYLFFLWNVVLKRRHPKIYNSWRICREQISGFSINNYRGYDTFEEAQVEYQSFVVDQAMAI
jgi:hypothetical protein